MVARWAVFKGVEWNLLGLKLILDLYWEFAVKLFLATLTFNYPTCGFFTLVSRRSNCLSIVGSVVECSPATRAARVRFPDDAVDTFY